VSTQDFIVRRNDHVKELKSTGVDSIHDPSLYCAHYSEIESILEIEEPQLYDRKDKDSNSNSLLSSSDTLFQIKRAHLMDADMVPDLLWILFSR
jgi:hypothetical protein